MLQTIHDKSKGWLAYVIVGFISIPFMLWGINSYLGGGDKLLAAQVNGEDISLQAFQRALQTQRDRLREMFGGNVPAEMLEGAAIKQSVVEAMVRDELMRQFAESQNFQVSSEQVAQEIRSLPVFQENGKFSAEKYTQLLESRRMDKLGFEADIRYGMRLQQFRDALQSSEFLTSSEYELFNKLGNQKRSASYALVETKALESQVQVNDEQIAEYYESNKDQFLSEERLKLAYLELDPESVTDAIEVSEDEVRTFYEQESDRFKTPEARKVSHILLKRGEGVAEADLEQKAAEISKRLAEGAAFDALVQEYSEDTFTVDKGGDLGFVYPGDLDTALEAAIFAAEQGVPSEAVKTAQGVQFVLVTDIQSSTQKSYDDVKADAERELKQRQADTRLLSLSEQLLTLTYENPESLEIAADALGAEIKTTDWVTRQAGVGIGEEAKIREAGFSDDVLTSGRNSDILELDDGRQLVVRVQEHQAAATLPLDQVEDQVIAQLVSNGSREKAVELGGVLEAAVQAGTSIEKAAADVDGARYVQEVVMTRTGSEAPAEISGKVFKMAQPEAGGKTTSSLQMSNGDFVVIELSSVESGLVEEEKAMRDQTADILSSAYAERAFDAVYRFMESQAEIKIFNENL